MAILSKGTTYSDGNQVTSSNLNALVDSATFASGAVDDSTTQLSSGKIIVKDLGIATGKLATSAVTTAKIAGSNVTTAKIAAANITTSLIADSNVTKAKIENLADYKVLGNVSGGAAAPAEVAILDEDNMSSNSATSLATQQSIKAYVDTQLTAEDLDFAGDSGTGSVDLDGQTFTIAGSAGLDTSASSQTLTIALDFNEISDAAIADGDSIPFVDATDSTTKKEAIADIATLFAGTGLSASSSVLSVDASQTQITSVGTLGAGAISSGFGAIDNGSSAITTTGVGSFGSLDISGDVDIDGTLETDALSIASTAVTSTAAELNYNDTGASVGTVVASKTVTVNSDKDVSSFRNITLTGELDAATLDISGDADIDGTLEADAITVNGTALATVIAGTTVTNATNSAHVLVTDNESTNEENLITFVEGATSSTGNVGLEMDGNFAYNPSTGTVSATIFKGNIDAVDGDFDGTLEADAITIGGTAIGSLFSPLAGGSDIVTTGALNSGSITSGFGNIDIGSSNLTSTGSVSLGATSFNDNDITNVGSIALDTITNDGTDVTIDSSGDIILDADGADIRLKDDGTQFGRFANSSSNLIVASSISDKDILFNGSDGGVQITALTLDMSAAGAATFNDKITAVGTSVFTNLDISGDIDVDGTTNLDAVDIDGAVQIDSTLTVGVDDTGYDVKFFGATSGSYMQWDESTDDLILGGAAQIGVGITSPQAPIHTVGDTAFAEAAIFANNGSASSWARVDWSNDQASGTGIVYRDNSGNFVFRNDNSSGSAMTSIIMAGGSTAGNIAFYKDSSNEIARFDSAGKLGIGISPSHTLDVSGEFRVNGGGSGSIVVNDEDSSLCPTMTFLRNGGGTTTNDFIKFENSGGEVAAINASGGGYFSGNVGIGTNSPDELLHVKGGSDRPLVVESTDAFCFISLNDNSTSAQSAVMIGAQGDDLRIDAGDSERIRVESNGNVGINDSTPSERLSVSGNVSISGSLSKGSGSFKIPHPLESKRDTHNLVHSFLESPQADLIYRGRVDLVDGLASVNIDLASDMTDGTFVVLCRDVQSFTTNESGWTAVRSSVDGNILTIEAQDNTCTDSISWMVVGERQDEHMYDTEWTDENGKVIVEPLIPEPTPEPEVAEDLDSEEQAPEEEQEPEAQESETELSPEERLNVMFDPLANLQEEE